MAQVADQHRGHPLEHRVAGSMAPGIVHLLEAVDVEHDHRERLRDGFLKPPGELLLECPPVGQPCQRISCGAGLEPLDQPCVGDRDSGLVRQDSEQAEVIADVLMEPDLDGHDDAD